MSIQIYINYPKSCDFDHKNNYDLNRVETVDPEKLDRRLRKTVPGSSESIEGSTDHIVLQGQSCICKGRVRTLVGEEVPLYQGKLLFIIIYGFSPVNHTSNYDSTYNKGLEKSLVSIL